MPFFSLVLVHDKALAYPPGSSYSTACGSLNLTPYLTTSCNVTVTHDENAINTNRFNAKGKPNLNCSLNANLTLMSHPRKNPFGRL